MRSPYSSGCDVFCCFQQSMSSYSMLLMPSRYFRILPIKFAITDDHQKNQLSSNWFFIQFSCSILFENAFYSPSFRYFYFILFSLWYLTCIESTSVSIQHSEPREWLNRLTAYSTLYVSSTFYISLAPSHDKFPNALTVYIPFVDNFFFIFTFLCFYFRYLMFLFNYFI